MDLSINDIWRISSQVLHSAEYKNHYIAAIEKLLPNKTVKILDTASGAGFPAVNLFEKGYNITGCIQKDGEFTNSKNYQNISINLIEAEWQTLSKNIESNYNYLLNTDNSFIYMDGWTGKMLPKAEEEIWERVQLVLSNFFNTLSLNGVAIIAIGKHYYPSKNRSYKTLEGVVKINEVDHHVLWFNNVDWHKRHNIWETIIKTETRTYSCKQRAYLMTADEIAEQGLLAGFTSATIHRPEKVRDDFIVLTK